uniref:laccase n=1 Tax=Oryza glumipatula TaxID=40148 RepID=A0A0E0A7M3_9ORYZ
MASSSSSRLLFLLACSVLALLAGAEVHHHEFIVQETPVKRLCKTHNVITVNGQLPGPTLEVREGDTVVINVVNHAQYNVTIHWHGIRQFRTGWADGPEFVTQCPIKPGGSYKYRFTIEGQEGTLWWHAHSSWLRATVYGALIIRPRENKTYPFEKPAREVPLILGEWWDADPIQVIREAQRTGAAPNISDAYTINGQPGDLYNCSKEGRKSLTLVCVFYRPVCVRQCVANLQRHDNMHAETTAVPVKPGETALLRFINAALNQELFVSIAQHKMTVVGVDASYTKPFTTSVLMIAPGQTTDVLVTMDQAPTRYYLAARAYDSAQGVAFDNTTTTAVIEYDCGCATDFGPSIPPAFPVLPAFNDTNTATAFAAGIRSPHEVKIPGPVDENLFFTVGVGLFNCEPGQQCGGPNNTRFTASMNNISFVFPQTTSLLHAHYYGIPGVFTTDFPAYPPVQFDYTAQNVPRYLWQPVPATKLYKLKFGSVVQIVLQDTSIVSPENHPIHIHGYDFYILAEGFGNFDPKKDAKKFNYVDPPQRNTVAVPTNGWAVIRFVADNPGVWLMHCHLDVHITWGLAMAFLVEDGYGKLETLEAPPVDLPMC